MKRVTLSITCHKGPGRSGSLPDKFTTLKKIMNVIIQTSQIVSHATRRYILVVQTLKSRSGTYIRTLSFLYF